MNITQEQKLWYLDAVKRALMTNHGLSDARADASISAYQLQKRLELYPGIQLHYDVEDIADEIVEDGFAV